MDLRDGDAEFEPVEEGGGKSGGAGGGEESHDLGRCAVDGELGADGSESHRKGVVEGGNERVLRYVLMRVGVGFGDGGDEGELGEEGERGDLGWR